MYPRHFSIYPSRSILNIFKYILRIMVNNIHLICNISMRLNHFSWLGKSYATSFNSKKIFRWTPFQICGQNCAKSSLQVTNETLTFFIKRTIISINDYIYIYVCIVDCWMSLDQFWWVLLSKCARTHTGRFSQCRGYLSHWYLQTGILFIWFFHKYSIIYSNIIPLLYNLYMLIKNWNARPTFWYIAHALHEERIYNDWAR